jgi:hypothetical protein
MTLSPFEAMRWPLSQLIPQEVYKFVEGQRCVSWQSAIVTTYVIVWKSFDKKAVLMTETYRKTGT